MDSLSQYLQTLLHQLCSPFFPPLQIKLLSASLHSLCCFLLSLPHLHCCRASRRRSLICRAESLIHRRRVTGRAHRSLDFLYHQQSVCHAAPIVVMKWSCHFMCLLQYLQKLLFCETHIPTQVLSVLFCFLFFILFQEI